MLLIAKTKETKGSAAGEKEKLLETIEYARKKFGTFMEYWKDGISLVTAHGKLCIQVDRETESGEIETVLEPTDLHIDGLNFVLNAPVMQTLIREGRLRIWVPEIWKE